MRIARGQIGLFRADQVPDAGIEGQVGPLAEYDEADFDRVIAVNVKGTFLGLRYVLPVMIAQQSGSIINAASVAGTVGAPGLGAYCIMRVSMGPGQTALTRTPWRPTSPAAVRVRPRMACLLVQ